MRDHPTESLSGMAIFAKVVETKSFTAAANELGMSKSAVSKHISRLEDRLGARLLNRTTRRLGLTETGTAFYDRCARVVAEAQRRVPQEVPLPSERYRFEWGGQFENMERASNRLLIVVPAALALIFVLLYITYNRLRDVLLVFTAVPFASVGGLLALFLRDLPFSISAGVGFIALSGVSVLNSMVLVTFIRQLRSRGLPPDSYVLSGELVLVEDEEMVRTLSSRVLRLAGYTVREARHGLEALQLSDEEIQDIAVTVTDVVMPEMDGRELANHLLRLKPGMKVLYVSGYTDNEVTLSGLLVPDTAFLEKPFSPHSLTLKVHELLCS